MKFNTILILILSTIYQTYGQPFSFRFQQLTTIDGLPDNNVIGIFEDSKGFMWIRTMNGLSRYDGITFQNFFHHESNSNSLAGNFVYSIKEISGGFLLMGTDNGMSIYNINKNCFENFRIKDKKFLPGSGIIVMNVFSDDEKNIWLNYNGKLDVFDSLFNFKYCYTDAENGKILKGINTAQVDLKKDGNGNYWLSQNSKGLVCIEHNTKKASINKGLPDSLSENYGVRSMYIDKRQNIIWFSIRGFGLFRYDLKNKTVKNFKVKVENAFIQTEINIINDILFYDGKLLLASQRGLYIFNPDDFSYTSQIRNDTALYPLINSFLTCMYLSNDSILWIGTDAGLGKCNLKKQPFNFYSSEFKEKNQTTPFYINHFAVYKSKWIIAGSVENGLAAYNIQTHELKRIFDKETKDVTQNQFSKVYVDREDKIWVATYYGFKIYDLEKNELKVPEGLENKLWPGIARAFLEDTQGDYWMSYENKNAALIHCIKTKSGNFDTIYYRYSETGFPLYKINKIKEDAEGNIWISSSFSLGFLKWDRNSNTFIHYPKHKDRYEFVSDDYHDILPDDSQTVWLASGNCQGLIKYNCLTNTKEKFHAYDDLVTNQINTLCKDNNGILWLGTEKGIARFNPVSTTFRTFGVDDGIPEISFQGNSFFDSATNRIYMCTPNTIVYFNPDEIENKSSAKPIDKIYLLKFQVNGSDTVLVNALELTHQNNNLNFEFTCINFKHGEITEFAYQLNGLEKDWNYCGTRRFVNYSNLSPGEYSF